MVKDKPDEPCVQSVSLYHERLAPQTVSEHICTAEVTKNGRSPYAPQTGSPKSMTSVIKHSSICPQCKKTMVETYWGESSDGFCGVYGDGWTCPNPDCGMFCRFCIDTYSVYNKA